MIELNKCIKCNKDPAWLIHLDGDFPECIVSYMAACNIVDKTSCHDHYGFISDATVAKDTWNKFNE